MTRFRCDKLILKFLCSYLLGCRLGREIKDGNTTDRSKRILVQELIAFGYADGGYFHLEKEAVSRVASILGLDRGTVERIEAWVRQGADWSRRGSGLIVEGR